MSNINYETVIDFLREIQPQNTGLLWELEKYAKENHIPIIQPEVAHFLKVITLMKKPKKILEVGTAIGYSSILMSHFISQGSIIHTIEKDERMIMKAKQNIQKANLENNIFIFEGDAKEILPSLEYQYDMIFMDAAKGQYTYFFPFCLNLLNKDGVLISDNVLYQGMIADESFVVRRKKTIVKRLRHYLKEIHEHPQLQSSIIPIGDGVALSYKI